ncbi:MAG: hypothetical protein EOQ42_22280 [Mesorhizobium sp.]|uniref:hypothetical protein n=1 Tax=unclassified Mesorhizobium TaxID=325217 RepID=UPI000FE637C1|nr:MULTISPECIES: hypothetical protein [unclassified Mesorhizobium]RWB34531.1 MAG: hypothetical protein EOQ41_09230 [Mesorhizobium sp.]RWB56414.1 MAG: hypothetical protein EOQ42_22280 [Mesorhizobium sp.]RWC07505.1 MAG: hypothetical protein EOS51_27480 [Mesorhizobium sp.]RWD08476.1 MAG: hypothetical protein EOS57_24355 [Mesorhizobium sp.]RWD44591.1 MAG: hypothetical protein EOS35_16230 [Mesorhizobium sp.]
MIFTSDSSTCLHPLANDGDWAAEKLRIVHASMIDTGRMETSPDCSLLLQAILQFVRLRRDRADAVFDLLHL